MRLCLGQTTIYNISVILDDTAQIYVYGKKKYPNNAKYSCKDRTPSKLQHSSANDALEQPSCENKVNRRRFFVI